MTDMFKRVMGTLPLVLRIVIEGVILASIAVPVTLVVFLLSLVFWVISLGHINFVTGVISYLNSPIADSRLYKYSAHLQWLNGDSHIVARVRGK